MIKLLTVVSVTLLPPTLLAGFLGMNSLPNSLKTTTAFWASAAVMLLLVSHDARRSPTDRGWT